MLRRSLKSWTEKSSIWRHGGWVPALLMRQSRRPYFSMVWSIRFLISDSLDMSHLMKWHSPGPFEMQLATNLAHKSNIMLVNFTWTKRLCYLHWSIILTFLSPFALSSSTSLSPSFSPRAHKTTLEPFWTKTRTQPSPIPFEPPVTMTTLSW